MRRLLLMVCTAVCMAAPLRAQAPVVVKDPTLGTILGVVITGGGQFYAGRADQGAGLMALSLAAVIGGETLAVKPSCGADSTTGDFGCTPGNYTSLYIGVGIATAAWVYGWATAGRDARLYNAARGRLSQIAPYAHRTDGRTMLGLRLALR